MASGELNAKMREIFVQRGDQGPVVLFDVLVAHAVGHECLQSARERRHVAGVDVENVPRGLAGTIGCEEYTASATSSG